MAKSTTSRPSTRVVPLRKGATLEMVRLTCPDAVQALRIAERPSRPEAAILVILENTSGTGWLLLTIAHARNDVPLR